MLAKATVNLNESFQSRLRRSLRNLQEVSNLVFYAQSKAPCINVRFSFLSIILLNNTQGTGHDQHIAAARDLQQEERKNLQREIWISLVLKKEFTFAQTESSLCAWLSETNLPHKERF